MQNVLNRGSLAGVALTNLESKVKTVLSSLHGMYDTLDANVNQTQQQIDDVSWTLQQAEQASYEFYPTEAALEAVPANWKKEGDKDGVSGVLLLTDQRLVFEQKEEVATKKVLFIANVDEEDVLGQSEAVSALRQRAASLGGAVVPVCAKLEAEIIELPKA